MRRLGLALGLAVGCFVSAGGVAFARCENVAPGQRPQNTAREFVGQTLDEIVDRGTLTIAVYEDFPPYSWQEGETPKGVDIEVGRILAEGLGVQPEFRFVQAGETLQTDLMSYVWRGTVQREPVSNVMLRVPYNSAFTCLVEQVVFTGQYANEQIAIAYSREAYPDAVPSDKDRHDDAPVPAFFRFDTVAVENDSIADFYLTAFPGGQIGPNIRRFGAMAEGMAALAQGEVMAAMGPLAQLEFALAEGIAVHRPPLPNFALSSWTVGIAVHHSHRDLAYALDDAITAALGDGRIEAAYAAYGLHFLPPDR
ncbi:substrate-binding periplasmic protein [Pseudotabrizicola algicola]|uniref:Amino acid ABC transporter substrate-binding protein n=1 Tax=Pseudotabrizicola algicola TaxID=2709381 RepID=A0A6B3RP63_9RHOB|nr:transporter substrate-binding domain-containing protein [Pseudotabrizicola algicola]NEX47934.1 amino acid ABC transporter substrate-binding protein [Pseudotabrizicola algicola]